MARINLMLNGWKLWAAAMLMGGIGITLLAPLIDPVTSAWRVPVRSWLMYAGLPGMAGYAGLISLYTSNVVVCSLMGYLLGWMAARRWHRACLIALCVYLLVPYFVAAIDGTMQFMIADTLNGQLMMTGMSLGSTLPFALLFGWLASRPRHRRREVRRLAGLCPNCGYDLRATVENRCPECGTAQESGKSKAT